MEVPVVVQLPKTHMALSKPEVWNSEWESLYSTKMLTPENCLRLAIKADSFSPSGSDLQYYSDLFKMTCAVRHDIGVTVTKFGERFRPGWLQASAATRKKHVLTALSEACSMARNLNDARAYCADELTIAHLSENGQVVVDMLYALLPDDLSHVPASPYYFPNTNWDTFEKIHEASNARNEEKNILAEVIILRTKLIYHVLFFIFLSFLGVDRPKVMVKKYKKTPAAPGSSSDREIMEQLMGKEYVKKNAKEDKAAAKERAQQRGVVCTLPGCPNIQQNDGERFKRCAKCMSEVKREVTYCSPDCQKKDWKLRHRKICGKPMDLESAREHASASPLLTKTLQVGPPVDGYKRTPVLLEHIRRLNNNPDADLYIKVFPLAQGEAAFIFIQTPIPALKTLIRAAREKAMTTGDRASVIQLCQYAVWYCVTAPSEDRERWNRDFMLDNMRKEFDFPDLRARVLAETNKMPFIDQLDADSLMQYLRAYNIGENIQSLVQGRVA
ncbi:hypothetical protein C8J56DRAFT_917055 [Mycena floridula]|nr:hypothetical protein C8J56DRAFT_917055 [Mycena floridula]